MAAIKSMKIKAFKLCSTLVTVNQIKHFNVSNFLSFLSVSIFKNVQKVNTMCATTTTTTATATPLFD